ncbi:hypothetical protein [Nonomuraea roseoviolacea]|uniref:Uncharacterized protein n=1 Tax=Nonomuraea roseoviolacea subsp. carminata TaxID=160689 RepID=A0ABT1JYW2_9ACTN|nr:hypothetical protein [Nonomuraea roseoviolacea]MCP2346936.1 hypothetical protein [Nonomuraea roseoviolacea subsp. carminata]
MQERSFRSAGGGTVVWTYTEKRHLLEVGIYTCSGCRHTSRPVPWEDANKHANACRQIP